MHLLFIENQRLAAMHVSLSQELSAAQRDLRHLSAVAVKVKAERDAKVREVYDRAVKMEAEVKVIDESNAELARILIDLQRLRSEKKELDEKLKKLRRDVVKVSDEWNQVPVVKSEIENLQKEIQRGREVIEHEKRVHASNIKQSQSMEDYKILMVGEIMKLQVEAIDAGKRARAAAAAEAASIPGNSFQKTFKVEYIDQLLTRRFDCKNPRSNITNTRDAAIPIHNKPKDHHGPPGNS